MLPLPHTHGDELTASKWVRGNLFVANIWHAAQPLPPFPSRRDELVLPPHTHTHGDELTASGACTATETKSWVWGEGRELVGGVVGVNSSQE